MIFKEALKYAGSGERVFPVWWIESGACACWKKKECTSPGKHPITPRGFKEATFEESVIQGWIEEWPKANIGLVTGESSDIVVLDIDREEAFFELQDELGRFPETRKSKTSRGYHLFFKYPRGRSVKSRPLRKNIDIKANGGYVIVPPSIHNSGERYQWIDNHPKAPIPISLLPLVLAAAPRAVVDKERVMIAEGTRHRAFVRIGGKLRNSGICSEAILECLLAIKKYHVDPFQGSYRHLFGSREVEGIASGLGQYAPGPLGSHASYQPSDIEALIRNTLGA